MAAKARASIARAVIVIASLLAAVLVVGILLVLLKANRSNDVVKAVHDAASFLAGPFDGLFTFDRRRVETAVNWGIAAVVWYALGRVMVRQGPRCVRPLRAPIWHAHNLGENSPRPPAFRRL